MWTVENRGSYDRGGLRYPSDLTDDEWAHIAPLIPPAKRGGRKRNVAVRDVVNGLMYILSTGCQWRAIPKDLPPRSTLFGYFELWDYDGTLDRIHHSLYVKCREAIGREASPTACVIDSQSVKGAEKGGPASIRRATMRVRRSKGKKRHILVDTVGLLLHAIVHPANIQDRDGGVLVLGTLFGRFPFLKKISADGGYQGPVFDHARKKILPHLETEIVKRCDTAVGFEVIPRRWVVERTFAWLGRCRRLVKDFENRTRTARAFLLLASIRLMLRKLCLNT